MITVHITQHEANRFKRKDNEMKEFMRINPDTGRVIKGKIRRKQNIRYQYRDTETKHFLGKNEMRRRLRKYKAELKRKDKRVSIVGDAAINGYSAYNRSAMKAVCKVELCGVWAEPSNIIRSKGESK